MTITVEEAEQKFISQEEPIHEDEQTQEDAGNKNRPVVAIVIAILALLFLMVIIFGYIYYIGTGPA